MTTYSDIGDGDWLERFDAGVELRSAGVDEEPDDLLAALGALEVAQEELRVADEEMTAQREQIDVLLARQGSGEEWRARLIASLPVPVLRTTASGVITDANAAAALVLHRRPVHLTGKPLAVLVHPDDRAELRRTVSAMAGSARESHLRLRVAPTGLPVRQATISVLAEELPDRTSGLRWVLSIDQGGDPEQRGDMEARAVAAMAAITELPVATGDRQEMVRRLAELARRAIPGADAVSVTLGSPGAPDALASDTKLAQEVDAHQMFTGQGPCVEAFATREVISTLDVTVDERWPALAERLHGHVEVGGALAVPVSNAVQQGVLNVYSRRRASFGPLESRVAELVASAVSAVLRTAAEHDHLAEQARNLNVALESRAEIDQAKGIVMACYGCTSDEAFTRLSALSQRSNVKLREIARLLVAEVARGTGSAAVVMQQLGPAVNPRAGP